MTAEKLRDEAPALRRLRLTPASAIRLRRVEWLWRDRLPVGELTLLGGREGIGKSLWQASLAARLTRGTLPGACHGAPRAVLLVAAEDDWSKTIAPRLHAAGADLGLVHRVDVLTGDTPGHVVLPLDTTRLEDAIGEVAAAAVFIDPLISVLDGKLDSHRDAEVRQALEPLAALAHRSTATVQGLVHVGKADRPDVVNAILGSRAFSAVPRAVLAAGRDPDDEDGTCVLSVEKSNLGSLDVPGIRYRVEDVPVPTDDGPASVGRLALLGESERRVRDFYGKDANPPDREERKDAKSYLLDALSNGPRRSKDIEEEAREMHNIAGRTLDRARRDLGVTAHKDGREWWLTHVKDARAPHTDSGALASFTTRETGNVVPLHGKEDR